MCLECGTYRGRAVVNMEAQLAKKKARQKRKAKEMGRESKKEGE